MHAINVTHVRSLDDAAGAAVGGAVPDPAEELARLRAENAALQSRIRRLEGREAPAGSAATLRGDDARLAENLEALVEPGGTARDVARREEQLRHLLTELREAVTARDAFLSIASHELKTPLTTLGLIADGLERGIGTRAERDLALRARRLRRQVDRLDDLVEQLIDVSEMAAGRPELHPEPADLARLVREEAERHREHLERTGSPLVVATPQPLPGRWDRRRIAQMVSHLLHNAGKYGRGRPIDVRCERGDGYARIEVADAGIGIAPADQRRIFERFERAVTMRHYGGLGLGLWLTRRLVEAMGGEIQVWSRPGAGARFSVYLPLEGGEAGS